MARKGSALERASAALSKASSSATRKSAADSEISDDAAELNRFLSGLSQKTKGGKPSNRVVPTTLSDISISSDDDFVSKTKESPAAPISSSGSKFMKSSKPVPATPSKQLPVKSISSSPAVTNQSPALLRLSEQTQRFLNKSKGASMTKTSNSLHISEDSTIVSETSESVGAGGNKFLKSKQSNAEDKPKALGGTKRYQKTPVPAAHSLRTSTEDDSDMAAFIQRLSPSASEVSDDENIKAKPMFSLPEQQSSSVVNRATTKDESSFATETFSAESSMASASVHKSSAYNKSDESEILTDSEGESPLAANLLDINALSLSPAINTHSKPTEKSSSSAKKAAQPAKKGPSHKGRDKKSQPTELFGSLGLMSVDDLLPTQHSSVRTVSQSDLENSIPTESSIKSYKATTKPRVRSDSESSIHTYKESVKTHSIDSEIHTHSTTKVDDYASDFDDTLKETESIATDSGSRSHDSQSCSDRSLAVRSRDRSNSTDSYSTARTRSRSYSRSRSPSRSRTYSSSRTYSRSTSYSRSGPTYGSRSPSQESISIRSSLPRRSRSPSGSQSQKYSRSPSPSRSPRQTSIHETLSEKSSASHNYTSSFEEHVETPREPSKAAVKMSDACVQTGLQLDEMILKYYWMNDQAVPSVSSGQQTREPLPDPPRIAGMAVSNEALEVLTTYNPALLALNDMMKQQVELSRQFLNMQQDIHKSIMGSIEREHVYTTLEDTNKYIESRRKPRLTFDEAVAMVKEEMNL